MRDQKTNPLVNRIKALQRVGLGGKEAQRPLAEIAAFVGSDRTAPYQWVAGKSRPARRALVRLALFELTGGDKTQLSAFATGDQKAQIITKTTEWFEEAGYPPTEIDTLVAEEITKLEISSRQDKLALMADKEPYDVKLIKAAEEYNDNLDGVRRMSERVRWKLLMNRLSQQEASEAVSNWHRDCEDGRGALVEADGTTELRSRLTDVTDFIEQLISSEHCRGFDRFVIPLGPPGSKEMDDFIKDLKDSAMKLDQNRAPTYVWSGPPPVSCPSAVWAFNEIRKSKQFGRLLIPSAFDPEISEALAVLHHRQSDLDTDYNPLLWSLHSTPLSWDMDLELLKTRMVEFDGGVFKPFDSPRTLQQSASPETSGHWVKLE